MLQRWAAKATEKTADWLIDSDFRSIYDDPRFQALLARFGLPAGPFIQTGHRPSAKTEKSDAPLDEPKNLGAGDVGC